MKDSHFLRFRSTGTSEDFRGVVEHHISQVHGTARRRLGIFSAHAEDVTQMVFVKLAKVGPSLPEDTVASAWLHRQTVSMSIDIIRSEIRRGKRENQAVGKRDFLPVQDSGEPAIFGILDDAVECLSGSDRAVLLMRFFDEMDYAGMAEALRTTPEAARKRVSRILEKLRSILSQRGSSISGAALSGVLTEARGACVPPDLPGRTVSAAVIGRKNLPRFIGADAASHLMSVGFGAAAVWIGIALWWWTGSSARSAGEREVHPAEAAITEATTSAVASPSAGYSYPEPRTVAEIVEAIRAQYQRPLSWRGKLTLNSLLGKVVPEDFAAFFALAEKLIPAGDLVDLWQRAADRWSDCPEALTRAMFVNDSKHVESLAGRFRVLPSITVGSDPDGRRAIYFSRMDDAYGQWLKSAPDAAARWLKDNFFSPLLHRRIFPTKSSGSLGDFLLARLLASPEAKRTSSGLSLLQSLQEQGQGEIALNMFVAQHFYRDSGPDRTTVEQLRAMARLFEETGNAQAARQLGFRWKSYRPEEYETEISNPSLSGRYQLALGAMMNSRDQDTFRGVQKALDLRPLTGSSDELVLREIAEAWLDNNYQGVDNLVGFLKDKRGQMNSDPALASVARRLASKFNKMDKALEVAAAITESPDRDLLMRGIYRLWLDVDPKRAAGFPDKSKWTAGQLAVINDLIPAK